jgi:hypothetical protein
MTDHDHGHPHARPVPFTPTEHAEIARLVADATRAQLVLNATFRGILIGRGYDDATAARSHIAPDASGWLVEPLAPPDPPDDPPGGTP